MFVAFTTSKGAFRTNREGYLEDLALEGLVKASWKREEDKPSPLVALATVLAFFLIGFILGWFSKGVF